MELFICGKILFCKKDMNWGKTAHGLVKENDLKEVKIERTDINDKKIENKKEENIEMEKDSILSLKIIS